MDKVTEKAIRKAIKNADIDCKLHFDKKISLKSGGKFLVPDMWCGVAMQWFKIDTADKTIYQGNIYNVKQRRFFKAYDNNKPINY